jgi:hypothetical protein
MGMFRQRERETELPERERERDWRVSEIKRQRERLTWREIERETDLQGGERQTETERQGEPGNRLRLTERGSGSQLGWGPPKRAGQGTLTQMINSESVAVATLELEYL